MCKCVDVYQFGEQTEHVIGSRSRGGVPGALSPLLPLDTGLPYKSFI